MKRFLSILPVCLVAIILLVGLLAFHRPARAAPTALSVTGVSPNSVVNNAPATLTISGSDFASGALASLDGYGSLSTTFVSTTTLTAALPVGVPAGVYGLTVTNPDSASASLASALTVLAPSATPTSTTTPTSTSTPPSGRPVMVVSAYSASVDKVKAGANFTVYVQVYNAGRLWATNVVASFTAADLTPSGTGGVIALGDIAPGNHANASQPVFASSDLTGKTVVSLDITLTYADMNSGAPFSEKFTLSFAVEQPRYVYYTPTPTPTATPTSTPAALLRPQLVITSYTTSVEPLQPGTQFMLQLEVKNLGNTAAKRVTMILGGGSSGGSVGTAEPGGTSGGSGDFTNFAPLGSSNVQSLGDMGIDQAASTSQSLIVNVSTNPGAYPLKISFTYLDDKNRSFTDDQVITLLVYNIPGLDVSFYRDPGPIFAGQPNILPIQLVNLGRKSAVLGNMRIAAEGAEFQNNIMLVGALEAGGYFTLDTTVTPFLPGALTLQVTVDYTDDFNQPQTIHKTITVEVLEPAVPVEPGNGGEGQGPVVVPPEMPVETFWDKLWRFIKGLLGLDSGRPVAPLVPGGEVPTEIVPPVKVIPGPKG